MVKTMLTHYYPLLTIINHCFIPTASVLVLLVLDEVDEVDEVEDPVTVEVVMLLVTVLYMPGNQ